MAAAGAALICILQDWIYRQLCETTMPIHTQLIPLIDAYINSILTPASKANPEATNQPITEQEILNVFLSCAGVSHHFGFFTYGIFYWWFVMVHDNI